MDRISTDGRQDRVPAKIALRVNGFGWVVGLDEAFHFHSPRFKNAAHKLAVLTPWNQGLETVENG